jgi:FkbM family methyltransferase
MRAELLYDPMLLIERLGHAATDRLRLRRIRKTPASVLKKGHIDSLELLELLRPLSPKVIYDIGANAGTWTLLAKSVYREAHVHCFEPLSGHLEKFRQATAKLTGVTAHQVCLGSVAGEARLRVLDFSDASSLLPLSDEGRRQWNLREARHETVKVERLDSWISGHRLPAPDLLKLDVQGFELEVLKGAERCLDQAKAVITEVSFREFYESQCLFHDVIHFMAAHGFWLTAIGHGVVLGRPLVQGDALFVKQHSMSRLR